MKWPGTGPRLELDRPVRGAGVQENLEIAGWAFPRGASVVRVEAAIAGGPASPLEYGLLRPDVAAVHGCDPACGFSGLLSLASAPKGRLRIEVVAVDARGRRSARRVGIFRRDDGNATEGTCLEIEKVLWRGERLEVEGFAVAPASGAWRSLRVEADGTAFGTVHRGLSRPDLAGRFGPRPEVIRSGFRFCGRPPRAGVLALVGEGEDGVVIRRPLERVRQQDAGAATGELSRWVEALAEELDRPATVLDATGQALASSLPQALVVTALDASTLPYAERSFDVVALGDAKANAGADAARLAQRLASRAVVHVPRAGALETLWRAESAADGFARVSVVIPVFNQSACTERCLRAVHETWPPRLRGEVLVVDDGSTDDTPERAVSWSQRDPRVRVLRLPQNQGFIAACNAGAAAATGERLVFLNNDTLPQPGWLPPLLRALEREHAGAVGGRLLYPDGTLQEAGGVVFDDGDACNFGRGDEEPERPLYAHLREVDYCSAAVLATPRALFLKLGGFDARYAPAYYEDTDYAFRLRENGYRVYYQPDSVVVHEEGATAGRDVGAGVKQYQALNRSTFVARWTNALADQPTHPGVLDRPALHALRARGRHPRRALVVLPTPPEPDRESGSRRAFHALELLLEAGWATSVVVENATGGERCARALRRLGAAFYAGPATRGAGSEYLLDLSTLVADERFDVALLFFWHVAERHLPLLRARSAHSRVLVDSVDLHFLREARAAFAGGADAGAALDPAFADRLRRELNVYGSADGVLTVSAKEAAWIDDLLARPGHARCVPDLEDAPGPPRPRDERRGLVFLGNFRHPPNVDALSLLAEIVARLDPSLLAAQPLSIVGNALEPRMLGPLAGHPHVRAVGWVPAVEPYLERALVSLAPLRQGAGTKRKLLQSLLAGTPCVSTPLGAEGLALEDGRELCVAHDAHAFARAVSRLVADAETWQRLSEQGRRAVVRGHARDVVRPLFRAALAGG